MTKKKATELRATENVAVFFDGKEHQVHAGDVVMSDDKFAKAHDWLFEPVE